MSPRATIADLAASSGDIDAREAAVVRHHRRHGRGLAVLPAPQRPEEADVVGQADLAAVLDAARNAYDAVVIDTGPLFDAAMLAALDHTDQLLLVCNPEVTSLKNVRIGLETIDRLGFDRERVSLVANRIGAARRRRPRRHRARARRGDRVRAARRPAGPGRGQPRAARRPRRRERARSHARSPSSCRRSSRRRLPRQATDRRAANGTPQRRFRLRGRR